MEQVAIADRPRAEAIVTAARGMVLGLDPRKDVLPALAPGGVAFVGVRGDAKGLEAAAALDVADRKDIGEAIDNGLRTLAALASLDKDRPGGPISVKVAERRGARVTSLAIGDRLPSFGATAKRVVLGTDPEVVARLLAGVEPGPRDAEEWLRLRDGYFPRCNGFAAVDLGKLHAYAAGNRERLAKQVVARDLERALELIEPFGKAFAAWDVAEDGKSAHQIIGLLGQTTTKR